jgi:hypothetical protein
MDNIKFNSIDDIEQVLDQCKRYLYKLIMAKAEVVGGLQELEAKTGIDKLARDIDRGKITDMLRIAKLLCK